MLKQAEDDAGPITLGPVFYTETFHTPKTHILLICVAFVVCFPPIVKIFGTPHIVTCQTPPHPPPSHRSSPGAAGVRGEAARRRALEGAAARSQPRAQAWQRRRFMWGFLLRSASYRHVLTVFLLNVQEQDEALFCLRALFPTPFHTLWRGTKKAQACGRPLRSGTRPCGRRIVRSIMAGLSVASFCGV